MRKEFEEYRDTDVLGSYHPEMAVLREQSNGEVMTMFRDTEYHRQEQYMECRRRCSSGAMCSM